MRYQGYGILYTWIGHQWVEVCRVEPTSHRPSRCSACLQNTIKPLTDWRGTVRTDIPPRNTITWDWVRHGSKLAEPLAVEYLCKTCKR